MCVHVPIIILYEHVRMYTSCVWLDNLLLPLYTKWRYLHSCLDNGWGSGGCSPLSTLLLSVWKCLRRAYTEQLSGNFVEINWSCLKVATCMPQSCLRKGCPLLLPKSRRLVYFGQLVARNIKGTDIIMTSQRSFFPWICWKWRTFSGQTRRQRT